MRAFVFFPSLLSISLLTLVILSCKFNAAHCSISKMPSYVAIVEGTALPSAKEFSVDILSGKQIVLHMNTRFVDDKTFFNTRDSKGQWGEEHHFRFSKLRPGQHFKITIKALQDGTFCVNVDGDTFRVAQRLFLGPSPKVQVHGQDVVITRTKILKGFALWQYNHLGR